jgi:hypothetical protein
VAIALGVPPVAAPLTDTVASDKNLDPLTVIVVVVSTFIVPDMLETEGGGNPPNLAAIRPLVMAFLKGIFFYPYANGARLPTQ